MAQGISLHIGLNRVDPSAYNGWDGTLAGCENDARSMKTIADGCGYASSILLNDQATSTAVVDAIGKAAQTLVAGDYMLLTYSGHGGQIDDTNGDEDDGKDETWVLFDRMLVDDELYSLWAQFAAGVRVFLLSDSCHSGTVARDMYVAQHEIMKKRYRGLPAAAPRLRAIPVGTAAAVEKRDKALYRTIQWIAGNSRDMPVQASVILISGCQDNQLSQDGDDNGLFTQSLLEVWNSGAFDGDYRSFSAAIIAKMPSSQTPNYFKVGTDDAEFETHKPFEILGGQSVQPQTGTSTSTSGGTTTGTGTGGGTGTGSSGTGSSGRKPTVTGPDSVTRSVVPTFEVDPGDNAYFIFEIASDKALFDNRPDPNNAQYYGSWNDVNAPARLTDAHYEMSSDAWSLVSGSDTLYYRVGTTSSSDGWDNYQVSDVGTISVSDSRSKDGPPPAESKPRRRHAADLP